MISPDKIDSIKNANDIAEVIGGYLTLKRTGANFKAPCPFHQEKTPSFVVSPEKQIYRCFGCGEGGNVFTFIQRMENFSFVEAVKHLAKRAGIEIDEIRPDPNFSEKETLLTANRETMNYFHEKFKVSEKAKTYAKERGIDDSTVEDFKIGYAPSDVSVSTYLKSKGISEDIMAKAGIAGQGTNGTYDMFRERFMFPILNLYNDVIGFGGRVFDEALPKYINSKETAVYIKGRNLYNLNNARKNAGDGTIIVVEGYMDCVTVYAAGIKNTVATLGTALTIDQAKLLKRYAERVVIMYDMDDAGKAGAIRAGDNVFCEGLEVAVVSFEEVKDPDDFIKKFGVDALREKIKAAQPFIEYKIDYLKKQGDINSAYFKEKVIKEIAELIEKIDSPMVRDNAIKKISEKLYVGLDVASRYFKVKNSLLTTTDPGHDFDDNLALKNKGADAAEKMIAAMALNALGTENEALILKHIQERREIQGLKYEDFKNTVYAEIIVKIKTYFKQGEKNILKRVEMDYVDNEEMNRIISELLVQKQVEGVAKKKVHTSDIMQEINDYVTRIQKEKTALEIEDIKQKISLAEAEKNTELIKDLLNQKEKLQKIMQQIND
ncbi:MAG: DNA primase [bacterium]